MENSIMLNPEIVKQAFRIVMEIIPEKLYRITGQFDYSDTGGPDELGVIKIYGVDLSSPERFRSVSYVCHTVENGAVGLRFGDHFEPIGKLY